MTMSFCRKKMFILTRNILRRSCMPISLRSSFNASASPLTSTIHQIKEANPFALISTKDILSKKVRDDIEEILRTMKSNMKTLTTYEAVETLDRLFQLCKNSIDMQTSDIQKREEFAEVSRLLLSNLAELDVNTLMRILNIMIFFDVPDKSSIVQNIVELVSKNNKMSCLAEIEKLLAAIRKQPHSAENKELQNHLLHLARHQTERRAFFGNVKEANAVLEIHCYHKLPAECVEVAVHVLYDLVKSSTKFDVETATRTLMSLRIIHLHPAQVTPVNKILTHCTDCLAENAQIWHFHEILRVLPSINRIAATSDWQPSNSFCESVGNFFCTRGCSFREGLLSLKLCNLLSHSHLPLLHHLVQQVIHDEGNILECKIPGLIEFLRSLEESNYDKTNNWSLLRPILEKRALLPDIVASRARDPVMALRLASAFAQLKIFPHHFLKHIISQDFIDTLGPSFDNYNDLRNLHALVTVFDPTFERPNIEEFLKEALALLLKQLNYARTRREVQRSLRVGLGHHKYVQYLAALKPGFMIDCVVVLQADGTPLILNTDDEKEKKVRFMEDLEIPPGCQKLAFACLGSHSRTSNTNEVKGATLVYFEALESFGYTVIPIHIAKWMNTPQPERTPSLMRMLNLA